MIGRTRSSRGRARNLSPEERQLWGKVARQITPLTRTTVAEFRPMRPICSLRHPAMARARPDHCPRVSVAHNHIPCLSRWPPSIAKPDRSSRGGMMPSMHVSICTSGPKFRHTAPCASSCSMPRRPEIDTCSSSPAKVVTRSTESCAARYHYGSKLLIFAVWWSGLIRPTRAMGVLARFTYVCVASVSKLQNEPTQVRVFGKIRHTLSHVGAIDLDRLTGPIRGRK